MEALSTKIISIIVTVLLTALLGRIGLGNIASKILGSSIGAAVQEWVTNISSDVPTKIPGTKSTPRSSYQRPISPPPKLCQSCSGAGHFTCKSCNGYGGLNYRGTIIPCGNCFGYGVVGCRQCSGDGLINDNSSCFFCGG